MPNKKFQLPASDIIKRGQEMCREMVTTLGNQGLLNEHAHDQEAIQYALLLLCLSGFYGTVSFAQFIRRVALVWGVWEENQVDPTDVQHELAYGDFLRQWKPEKGDKIS